MEGATLVVGFAQDICPELMEPGSAGDSGIYRVRLSVAKYNLLVQVEEVDLIIGHLHIPKPRGLQVSTVMNLWCTHFCRVYYSRFC